MLGPSIAVPIALLVPVVRVGVPPGHQVMSGLCLGRLTEGQRFALVSRPIEASPVVPSVLRQVHGFRAWFHAEKCRICRSTGPTIDGQVE
jgi:hypothetical protein